MARIDYWHTVMPFLGTRKIAAKLREKGYAAGRKLVRGYMREMGIHAVYPKPNLSKRNFKEATVPYLLRNKVVSFPNQVWSIDITYIRMHHGHMYLTAIIDWYSRRIVGWELSDTLDIRSVLETVQSAAANCGVPAILNSDQGSQFTSEEYKRFLRELHIRQSMDGRSRWADNIMIERWFRSLKTELIYVNESRRNCVVPSASILKPTIPFVPMSLWITLRLTRSSSTALPLTPPALTERPWPVE